MTVIIPLILHVCGEPPLHVPFLIFYAIIILHDVTFIYANQIELPVKKTKVNYTCNLYEDEDDCKIEVDGSLSSVRPNVSFHDM